MTLVKVCTAGYQEDGDADTNGAPAGAILGARFGYDAIPLEYTEGLNNYKGLTKIFEKLLTVIESSGF